LAAALTAPAAAQSSDSVSTIGWSQIAIATGAIAALSVIDGNVNRAFIGTSSSTRVVARQFDRFGDLTGMGPIVGGLALAGLVSHRKPLVRAAIKAAESVALASAFAEGSKYLVGRVRPYGDPDLDGYDFRFYSGSPSFPSGHSSAAFALATSLADAANNTWARIGLYGLAAGTGWARLAEDQHWLSDVAAGMAVGILSARTIGGRVRLLGIPTPSLLKAPVGAGLGWTVPLPEGGARRP
jgi:membrane-associated phospholipid phosphatase